MNLGVSEQNHRVVYPKYFAHRTQLVYIIRNVFQKLYSSRDLSSLSEYKLHDIVIRRFCSAPSRTDSIQIRRLTVQSKTAASRREPNWLLYVGRFATLKVNKFGSASRPPDERLSE